MDIEPEQVAGLAGAQLIDVREDYEWDEGRIPDSRHVPLMQVAALADSIDQELPVVFICENNFYAEFPPLAAATAGATSGAGRNIESLPDGSRVRPTPSQVTGNPPHG